MSPYACLPIYKSPYTPISPLKESFLGSVPGARSRPAFMRPVRGIGSKACVFSFLLCTALRPHAGTIYGLEGQMLVMCLDLEPQGICCRFLCRYVLTCFADSVVCYLYCRRPILQSCYCFLLLYTDCPS